jgi:hypothetical protein
MPKFEQPARRQKVNTFYASFDSDCSECGGEIIEGELAGYLPGDSQPSCGDCVREHSEE